MPETPAASPPTPPSPPQAIPQFAITHPSAAASQHWAKMHFHGAPGAGKTVLAGSADDVPEMKSVLYFDAEKGDMSLSDRPHLDIIQSKKYSQLARVHEYLRLHVRLRDEFLAGDQSAGEKLLNLEERIKGFRPTEPTLYRTFVIDSLTEIQQRLMWQLLAIDPDNWALDAVPMSAEWGEWKSGSDMILILLRQLVDLPMHIIVVSQELEIEAKGILHKRVNLPGKLPNKIPGFWDVYGYLMKAKDSEGKERRRLWLTEGETWKAKHRFRHLDVQYVDEPTVSKILDLAKAEWAAADKERTSTPTPTTGATTNARPAASSTQPRPAPRPISAPARPAAAGAGTASRSGGGPVRVAGQRPAGRR